VSGLKVMLVDDEEEFVKTLAERLDIRGFKTWVALNGERALEILPESIPDVMVLDLKMPGIDGLEVLRRVKRRAPQVQVIILTGHGSEGDREAALRLGAFEHLQKPIDMATLIETIKRAHAGVSKESEQEGRSL
jgi:DNA-binding response OmpR family regulator